jgi:hypothetical protein
MTISFAQMARGFYDRENFRDELEDDARVLRRDTDAAHPCSPDSLPSGDYVSVTEIEDDMIARIDAVRKAERRAKGKMPKATPEQRAAHERTIARKRAA